MDQTRIMNSEELRILILEDAIADAELCHRELKRAGLRFTSRRVDTRADFETALELFRPDLILSDYSLPGAFDGSDALKLARLKYPDIPFVFVSGTIGEERAVEAMKQGATDYVLKDRMSRLGPAVLQVMERTRLRNEKDRAELARREAEARYRDIFDNVVEGIVQVSLDGRVITANAAYARMLGYDSPEALATNVKDMSRQFWADPQEYTRFIEQLNREGLVHAYETQFRRAEGSTLWVSISSRAVRDAGGRVIHHLSIVEDITERKRTQSALDRMNRVLAVMSGVNSTIVRVRDQDELFREACRIAVEQGNFGLAWIGLPEPASFDVTPVAGAGLGTDELKQYKTTAHPDVPQGHGLIGQAIRGRKPAYSNNIFVGQGMSLRQREDALRLGYRSQIALPLFAEGAVAGVLVLFAKELNFFDADELKLLSELAGDISFALQSLARQEKLDYLSYYDPLTGVPNRALFIDRAGQQMRLRGGESLMVALILLNLERFRNVNETLGRHGGDELLKQVALRLENVFRGKDYIARIGADGFGVVVRGIRDAAAAVHAVENRALGCFVEPFKLNDKELRVAARAGIALYPADGGDADTLFKNAEAALKKARDFRERYLFYATDMNARAAQVLSLETRLRKAVEAQQFVLHFQPKINLENDSVCGLEALIRWQDPESGLVPPGVFIPLLEETGLILQVGKWVLAQALAHRHEWASRGCAVPPISVNVSTIQLQQKDFVDVVMTTVRQDGNAAGVLELEITESLLMKDVESSIRKLSILREQGIHVAMDDFGTGYSSLGYITRLPIDSLKVDRSFIQGMTSNPQDTTIVTTIIALAHSLNLRVVAEGVETGEQSQLLKLLKCDEAQGYLFSKPRPAAEIVPLLRAVA